MICQSVTGSDPSTVKKKRTEKSVYDKRNETNIRDKITMESFNIRLHSFLF